MLEHELVCSLIMNGNFPISLFEMELVELLDSESMTIDGTVLNGADYLWIGRINYGSTSVDMGKPQSRR